MNLLVILSMEGGGGAILFYIQNDLVFSFLSLSLFPFVPFLSLSLFPFVLETGLKQVWAYFTFGESCFGWTYSYFEIRRILVSRIWRI